MEEIWKSIDYDGYKISNLGRIKSYKYDKVNGILMNPYKDSNGYLQIDLSLDGRKRGNRVHLLIHRLVAKAFIPNPNNYPQVNHKDECKTNNCVNNLEWCTNEYNARYGTKSERVAVKRRKQIYSINVNGEIEYFNGIRAACRKLNVNECNAASICRVLKGKFKTALGRRWFYV